MTGVGIAPAQIRVQGPSLDARPTDAGAAGDAHLDRLCLAGRPGARLAATLAVRIAKGTLLDLLRSVPQPPTGPVRFLEVDDFALRKGNSYATTWLILRPAVRSMFCPAGTPSRWQRGFVGTRKWR